jgi:hypothetical protein
MNPNQNFAQWKAASKDDAHSLVSDPLFEDPLNYDFRMKAESPARSLGIKDIDISDVGPRKSVWDDAGAVWIDYPDPPGKPGFLPSDVPGLQMWITAKDLEVGGVSQWDDHTMNRYSVYQAYESRRPELVPGVLNGHPVAAFDDESWMSSSHKSLEVQGGFGKFDREDFAVFTVHRTTGDNQVVVAKGNDGSRGNWTIGELQNQLCWSGEVDIGRAGSDFELRCYRRSGELFRYFENGIPDSTTISDASAEFYRDWVHFHLGRKGGSEPDYLSGEIAEILVYRGGVSEEDMEKVWDYLRNEWGFQKPSTVDELSKGSFAIYPNPAEDEIFIRGVDAFIPGIGSLHDGVSFTISDVCGRELKRFDIIPGAEQRIQVRGLQPGIYFITLSGNGTDMMTRGFIKK